VNSLTGYLIDNPIFAVSFIFSRIPFWVLYFAFALGYMDGLSAVLAAVVILFAKGYVNQEVCAGNSAGAFFSTALLGPLKLLLGLILFVLLYPLLIVFLSAAPLLDQFLMLALIGCGVVFWLLKRRESFGKSTFGLSSLPQPRSFGLRLIVVFFWVYVIFGGDFAAYTTIAMIVILLLEMYIFTKKYEGII
jgi:hypothetical protein